MFIGWSDNRRQRFCRPNRLMLDVVLGSLPTGSASLSTHPSSPLRFGSVDGDRLSVLFFLQCLPNGWAGTLHNSDFREKGDPAAKHVVYDHVMKLTHPDSAFNFTVKLYWNRNCEKIDLYIRKPPKFSFPNNTELDVAGLKIRRSIDDLFFFTPLNGPPVDREASYERYAGAFGSSHPWMVLNQFLLSIKMRMIADGALLSQLPLNVTKFITGRQLRERSLKDFEATLKAKCTGWIKIFYTTVRDSILYRAPRKPGDRTPSTIFGLTHVFYWVKFLLTKCGPNCAMTDATFEIMEPYVLEILQVIVRNESIPIAVAVFPTETGRSYFNLYRHVLTVLKKIGVDPNVLRRLPLISDQGRGLKSFINKINKLEDNLNKADTLDLQGQVELIKWILCHRHLIENSGANSWEGDWVRQFLECCNLEEAMQVAVQVRLEIIEICKDADALARFCDTKNHRVLKSFLIGLQEASKFDLGLLWDAPADPIPMEAWARWLREGCPTTSNAIESIHRWLNALLQELCHANFLIRYLRVIKFLENRFLERDSKTRKDNRSTLRFHNRLEKMETPFTPRQQSLINFNCDLHGLGGQPWDISKDNPLWEFGRYDDDVPTQPFEVESEVITKGPPASFKTDKRKGLSEAQLKAWGLLNLDMPDDPDLIPEEQGEGQGNGMLDGISPTDPVNHFYLDTGWRIIRCVRRLMSEASWKSRNGFKVVIDAVFKEGDQYRGMGPIPLEQEVQWKFAVFKKLKVNLGV
jgi:hypothetical protein